MNRSGINPQFMAPLTQVVKWLLILNVGVWFLLQVLMEGFAKVPFTQFFQLVPVDVLFQYKIWQLFTYMFLHSQDGVTHILFNMLMLWFFGSELEMRWGSKFFIIYYLVCGVGAALLYCLGLAAYAALSGSQGEIYVPVVGASGALFGIMLAYGWVFGERVVSFMMLFPMKARYFVMLMGFIQLASLLSASRRGSEVAYLAHIGGLIVGFTFLWVWNYIQRMQWNQKTRKKARNLKLVVDNDKPTQGDPDDPKYWN